MLRVFGTDYETLLLTVRFILFSWHICMCSLWELSVSKDYEILPIKKTFRDWYAWSSSNVYVSSFSSFSELC